jgi:hypothetical protein
VWGFTGFPRFAIGIKTAAFMGGYQRLMYGNQQENEILNDLVV